MFSEKEILRLQKLESIKFLITKLEDKDLDKFQKLIDKDIDYISVKKIKNYEDLSQINVSKNIVLDLFQSIMIQFKKIK